jgi:hypothetical protein
MFQQRGHSERSSAIPPDGRGLGANGRGLGAGGRALGGGFMHGCGLFLFGSCMVVDYFYLAYVLLCTIFIWLMYGCGLFLMIFMLNS